MENVGPATADEHVVAAAAGNVVVAQPAGEDRPSDRAARIQRVVAVAAEKVHRTGDGIRRSFDLGGSDAELVGAGQAVNDDVGGGGEWAKAGTIQGDVQVAVAVGRLDGDGVVACRAADVQRAANHGDGDDANVD